MNSIHVCIIRKYTKVITATCLITALAYPTPIVTAQEPCDNGGPWPNTANNSCCASGTGNNFDTCITNGEGGCDSGAINCFVYEFENPASEICMGGPGSEGGRCGYDQTRSALKYSGECWDWEDDCWCEKDESNPQATTHGSCAS